MVRPSLGAGLTRRPADAGVARNMRLSLLRFVGAAGAAALEECVYDGAIVKGKRHCAAGGLGFVNGDMLVRNYIYIYVYIYIYIYI